MKRPLLANYYITTRCNARCVFCSIRRKSGMDAHSADVLRHLKDLSSLGVRIVDMTGGEPLLHPDLPLFLREAKRRGLKTTVTTNGILYPARAEEIRGLVDWLHFSLDSIDAAEHDRIRGVRCFDRVMESLAVAQRLGEDPDILFTVTPENHVRLEEMIDLARQAGRMLILNPVFSYFGNLPLDKEGLDRLRAASSLPFVYVNRAMIRFMKQGGNHTSHPRCRAVSTTVVLMPDNTVLWPCFHRPVRKMPLTTGLRDTAIQSARERWIKREGRLPMCEGCSVSCYFDPSFVLGMDDYFLLSQISKVKYLWDKHVRSGFRRKIRCPKDPGRRTEDFPPRTG